MNAGQAIAQILKAEGIEHIFCFPMTPILDSLAEAGIRPIVARQERVAENMADDAGIAVVFVQVSGESFDRRPIRVGIQDGTRTEILEGVAPGEKVVVNEAYLVHLASLSGVIPEHSH